MRVWFGAGDLDRSVHGFDINPGQVGLTFGTNAILSGIPCVREGIALQRTHILVCIPVYTD